mmetsp:Transcript_29856/g.100557  ORF Transcript_29856/g.100557 Transcript_29856/m.100557 type:complete len:206 (+) Transcript_29856:1482-2099(+)
MVRLLLIRHLPKELSPLGVVDTGHVAHALCVFVADEPDAFVGSVRVCHHLGEKNVDEVIKLRREAIFDGAPVLRDLAALERVRREHARHGGAQARVLQRCDAGNTRAVVHRRTRAAVEPRHGRQVERRGAAVEHFGDDAAQGEDVHWFFQRPSPRAVAPRARRRGPRRREEALGRDVAPRSGVGTAGAKVVVDLWPIVRQVRRFK